jgi:hypothetical protein
LLLTDDADSTEAFECFQRAAANEVVDAYYELGECYMHGEAVPRSETLGVKWFSRGAEQEHGRCLWRLAALFEAGSATFKHDRSKALGYLKRAVVTKISPPNDLDRAVEALGLLVNLDASVAKALAHCEAVRAATQDWFIVQNKPVPDNVGPENPVDHRFLNLTSLCTIDRSKPLRFNEGDVVLANVGPWKRARVIRVWDDGNPYRLLVGGDRGSNVWALEDSDHYVQGVPPLRFKVGDKVVASLATWRNASVTRLWGSDDDGIYAYELKITEIGPDFGIFVWADHDTDTYIRRRGKGKR